MSNYILCCDWGTTSFRLKLVDKNDFKVLAELQSADGVASTFRAWQEQNEIDRFAFYTQKIKTKIQELTEHSGLELSKVPLIVSGMASSSIGIEEIPYASLPFATDGSQVSVRTFVNLNNLSNPLTLVSGVRSNEDVMRGEEAQLIGLFNLSEISLKNKSNAVFVFPGTHSKHLYVKDGYITNFRTFMTGELFNLMSEHSILKDSITLSSVSGLTNQANETAFKQGVEFSGTSPILHSLFTVRTNQLFDKLTKEQNSFYLSGLLIGTELRQLSENTEQIIVCSGTNLYDHYKLALKVLGLSEGVTFIKADLIDKATVAGQVQIFIALNRSSNE